jgi:hypothetical protein
MQTINYRRVALGGLLASVVLLAGEMALIGALHTTIMAARDAAKMPVSAPNPVLGLAELLLTGAFLMWLYAAMRPRFGAGPGTALRSGATAWFALGVIVTIHMVNDNFGLPVYLLIVIGAGMLPCFLAASVAGGWVYRE